MLKNYLLGLVSASLALGLSNWTQATTLFTSTLDSSQVVAGSTSTATGTATMQFLDGASPTLKYSITLNELKLHSHGGTITKVHFHLGSRGTGSPFHVFNIYDPKHGNDGDLLITGEDTFNPTFAGTWTDDDVTGLVDPAYLSNPDTTKPLSLYIDELLGEQIYLNIHTATYPSGEIRGQIEIAPGQSIPEPFTLLGSATAIGFGFFFKRKLPKQ